MTYAELVARLEGAMRDAPPGLDAQDLMAPRPRRQWPRNPARIRNAAGLLVAFPAAPALGSRQSPSSDAAHIVLTVRSETVRHGGQVSLPGGVIEPGETFEQAALREAHEEIGLIPDTVRIVGALTPLDIPVSGFRLHPIVGLVDRRPQLTPSDGEVARILEVAVDDLFAPERLIQLERRRGDDRVIAPAFRIDTAEIWGATAMVLAEFLVLLGWSPSRRI